VHDPPVLLASLRDLSDDLEDLPEHSRSAPSADFDSSLASLQATVIKGIATLEAAPENAAECEAAAQRCTDAVRVAVAARILPDLDISGPKWRACVAAAATCSWADIRREGMNIRQAGKSAKDAHGQAVTLDRFQRILNRLPNMQPTMEQIRALLRATKSGDQAAVKKVVDEYYSEEATKERATRTATDRERRTSERVAEGRPAEESDVEVEGDDETNPHLVVATMDTEVPASDAGAVQDAAVQHPLPPPPGPPPSKHSKSRMTPREAAEYDRKHAQPMDDESDG